MRTPRARRPVVLGVDVGLATFGWAAVKLGASAEDDQLLEVGAIATEKSDKKRQVRSSEDLVRRARELDRAIAFVNDRWTVAAVCAETMSWPRNSASSARIGIGWGILIGCVGDRPMAQASPQEVKLAMGLARSASKEEVQIAVRKRFGRRAFDRAQIHPALFEHAYDAAAVVVACLDNETIRMLRDRAA